MQASYALEMKLEVMQDRYGFDLDTSVVSFGKLKPGGISTRYFHINNTGETTAQVLVVPKGELAKWVFITPERFAITPAQRKGVFNAEVHVPADAVPGNYSGILKVYVFR
jgi:hypothetical protein